MERLFLFVYQNRAFFTFLSLEFLCAWMIVSSNHYQSAQFFNSSGSLVANMNSLSYSVSEYFSLRETNLKLAEENSSLRTQLEQRTLEHYPVITTPSLTPDSANAAAPVDTLEVVDSIRINRFEYVSAKVVNNSVDRFTNFITINKGSDAGIKEGMAVISSDGVIGKIKATSPHFSVVISLLNIDVMVSGMLKRTGHFGTIHWEGQDPEHINLNYIPRHVKPVVGDSIVTSGYNAVFPEGILIGVIDDVELNEADPFYQLKVKLSQDFQKLTYISVVKSNLKVEQDSLEQPFTDIAK